MLDRMKLSRIIQTTNAFLMAKLFKKKSPLVVGWAITNKCDRMCSYCGIWQRQGKDLATRQVFEIVDSLSGLGTIRISFTGGEPLMRKDIGAIIDYVHSKGIETKLNTNGALLKKRIGELNNLDMLNLSLEGPEKTHDAIRGNGSYKEVMEAITVAGIYNIRVNFATVLTRLNLNSLGFILDVAGKNNSMVMFQPATLKTLGGNKLNDLVPSEDEYRNAINGLIARKISGDTVISNSVTGLRHLLKWPHPAPMTCASGWISCRIDSGGDVMYCSRESTQFLTKNCTTVSFKEAFDNLTPVSCNDCWCAARVELNQAFSCKSSVLANQIRMLSK